MASFKHITTINLLLTQRRWQSSQPTAQDVPMHTRLQARSWRLNAFKPLVIDFIIAAKSAISFIQTVTDSSFDLSLPTSSNNV